MRRAAGRSAGFPYRASVGFAPPVRDSALFREIVTELKDMNQDCSCTPRDFRAESKGLADKFLRDIDWYCTPYYQAVHPTLSPDDVI